MDDALARTRSARKSLYHWLRLIERQGSLVRAFTGAATPLQQQHYPPGDLRDPGSGSQCYYHCHRGDGEHGHLHLFRRPRPGAPLTHLIAISLDGRGLPLALFSVNRWVSEDRWLPAAACLRLLEGVSLSGASCDPHLGSWLQHFLRFYRPTLETVLTRRDRRLRRWAPSLAAALEARDLEIPSHCPIDWAADLAAAEAQLAVAPVDRSSVGQAEARAQAHPEGRSQQGEGDPQPAVQAGGGDAGQVGPHIATEGEPGPVAHQQSPQQGSGHRRG
jgi:hypothetical protein